MESYQIIWDINGDSCCNNCGRVIESDRFSDGPIFQNNNREYALLTGKEKNSIYGDTEPGKSEDEQRISKCPTLLSKCKQRDSYFWEVLRSFSDSVSGLSNELKKTIWIQAKGQGQLFDKFIESPGKHSTQALLRAITLPEDKGKKFKSRITGMDLKKLNRKNIKMRWLEIMKFILDMQGLDCHFIHLNIELSIILKTMHQWIMDRYGKKRHTRSCPNWENTGIDNTCCCRKSRINAYTMIWTFLYMLNPLFINQYRYTIPIPKLKTFKKNLYLMQDILEKTYGIDSLHLVKDSILGYVHETFEKNKYIVDNILSKDINKIEEFLCSILLSRKKEDWLMTLLKVLTPVFYPTIWRKYLDHCSIKKDSSNN